MRSHQALWASSSGQSFSITSPPFSSRISINFACLSGIVILGSFSLSSIPSSCSSLGEASALGTSLTVTTLPITHPGDKLIGLAVPFRKTRWTDRLPGFMSHCILKTYRPTGKFASSLAYGTWVITFSFIVVIMVSAVLPLTMLDPNAGMTTGLHSFTTSLRSFGSPIVFIGNGSLGLQLAR